MRKQEEAGGNGLLKVGKISHMTLLASITASNVFLRMIALIMQPRAQ